MTAGNMVALGWSPEKVISINWLSNNLPTTWQSPQGVLAIVIPGRNFLAAIEDLDDTGMHSRLSIIDPNGGMHLSIPNCQIINGMRMIGKFRWFEPTSPIVPDNFGVIFEVDRGATYKLDISAPDARVVNVSLVR